jgi:hypothetical protein
MALEIVPLAREHLAAVRRFAEKVWQRPRSDAYYRWRYEEPSAFQLGYLALRDGECLAMECAFRRPYRTGERTLDVLEVFDWYTLPELRGSGLGMRVMQALMREPHPLMLVGGSADTQALLPRLGWRHVATSSRWVLALGVERTREALQRRLRIPPAAAPLARAAAWAAVHRPGVQPRRRAAPRGGRVFAVAGAGDDLQKLYRAPTRYGTLPLWSDAQLRWLTGGFPALGHYVPLYFAVGERVVGFALLRAYPTEHGCDVEILDLYAPEPDASLYAWMVSEVALRGAGFAPGVVATSTTCPLVEQALRRNRFVRTSAVPVQFSLPGGAELPGPILIGSNTSDVPFNPLAERWFE